MAQRKQPLSQPIYGDTRFQFKDNTIKTYNTMEAITRIKNVSIDNSERFVSEIDGKNDFQFMVFDPLDDVSKLGVFIERTDRSIDATLMFYISKKQAIFLGKALIAIAENLPDVGGNDDQDF